MFGRGEVVCKGVGPVCESCFAEESFGTVTGSESPDCGVLIDDGRCKCVSADSFAGVFVLTGSGDVCEAVDQRCEERGAVFLRRGSIGAEGGWDRGAGYECECS